MIQKIWTCSFICMDWTVILVFSHRERHNLGNILHIWLDGSRRERCVATLAFIRARHLGKADKFSVVVEGLMGPVYHGLTRPCLAMPTKLYSFLHTTNAIQPYKGTD